MSLTITIVKRNHDQSVSMRVVEDGVTTTVGVSPYEVADDMHGVSVYVMDPFGTLDCLYRAYFYVAMPDFRDMDDAAVAKLAAKALPKLSDDVIRAYSVRKTADDVLTFMCDNDETLDEAVEDVGVDVMKQVKKA